MEMNSGKQTKQGRLVNILAKMPLSIYFYNLLTVWDLDVLTQLHGKTQNLDFFFFFKWLSLS